MHVCFVVQAQEGRGYCKSVLVLLIALVHCGKCELLDHTRAVIELGVEMGEMHLFEMETTETIM